MVHTVITLPIQLKEMINDRRQTVTKRSSTQTLRVNRLFQTVLLLDFQMIILSPRKLVIENESAQRKHVTTKICRKQNSIATKQIRKKNFIERKTSLIILTETKR